MKKKVLVIGDAMLDIRRFGRCTRVNPENPNCKVLDVQEQRLELGGAANVARWLAARPELDVDLFCQYGDDDDGDRLADLCEAAGVHLSTTFKQCSHKSRTTVKERLCQVKDGQIEHLLRVDSDTTDWLTEDDLETLKTWSMVTEIDPSAVVIADYRKGVFLGKWGEKLIELIGEHWPNALKVVNSKAPSAWAAVPINYLVCNDKEALQSWPDGADNHYGERVGASYFVRTQGAQGVSLTAKSIQRTLHVPTLAKQIVDVTGAGDAFVAGLTAAALTDRGAFLQQLETGSAWAAHCCGQIGCGEPVGLKESENVNMQLLGWTVINGLCYNGNSIFQNVKTGELAYEDMNHQCRLGTLPAAVEAIIQAQL